MSKESPKGLEIPREEIDRITKLLESGAYPTQTASVSIPQITDKGVIWLNVRIDGFCLLVYQQVIAKAWTSLDKESDPDHHSHRINVGQLSLQLHGQANQSKHCKNCNYLWISESYTGCYNVSAISACQGPTIKPVTVKWPLS